MSRPLPRLAAFLVLLLLVFAGAAWLGATLDPDGASNGGPGPHGSGAETHGGVPHARPGHDGLAAAEGAPR